MPKKGSAPLSLLGLALAALVCFGGACEAPPPNSKGLAIRISPEGGRLKAGGEVYLETTEPSVIYYSLDQTPPGPGSLVYQAPLHLWSSGRLRAVALDRQGQKGEEIAVDFAVDALFPRSLATPGSGNFREAIEVALTADDPAATIFYTLDGQPPTTASLRYERPLRIEGDTVLQFFSIDRDGNAEGLQIVEYNFAPRIAIQPPSGVYRTSEILVRFELNEPSRIDYSLPGTSWLRYEQPFSLRRDAEIQYRAVDLRGFPSIVQSAFYGIMEALGAREMAFQAPESVSALALFDPEGFGFPSLVAAKGRTLWLHSVEGSEGKLGEGRQIGALEKEIKSIRAWDLDGDGLCDILVQDQDEHWKVFLGEGGGLWRPDRSLLPILEGRAFRSIVPLDLEGDGQLDLFLVDRQRLESLFLRQEKGRYIPKTMQGWALEEDTEDALAGDLNLDTHKDLLILPKAGAFPYIAYGEGQGNFRLRPLRGLLEPIEGQPIRWLHAAFGDLDGDGDQDIVLVGVGPAPPSETKESKEDKQEDVTTIVLLQQIPGEGWKRNDVIRVAGSALRGLQWIDLDGDPHLDLMLTRQGLPPLVFKNFQGRSFLPVGALAKIPSDALSPAVSGDLGQDGFAEIVLLQPSQAGRILRSSTPKAGLRLVPLGLRGNRSSLGTRLRLRLDGRILLREVGLLTTGPDQAELLLPIGLRDAQTLGPLWIRWTDGLEREIPAIDPDKPLILHPQP